MPFLAAGALVGGLSAGAVAGGMTAATGAMLGASLGSAAQGYFDGKSAQKAANAAAQNAKVDIAALDEQTRKIAKQNALDAAELERQLTPEVPMLRTAANNAVLNSIGGSDEQRQAAQFLMARMNQPMTNATFGDTPLLREAIAKARADLAQGGHLSLDQRNAATRGAAATAGSVGGGGLGLGRDLTARDLGLTSYNVEQQRLQNATNLGNLELSQQGALANFNLSRDSANAANFLSNYGALNTYYNNLRQQDLAAAAYGQSIPQPVVGLDPSAVANLTVANQNAQTQAAMNSANIKAQSGQNMLGFAGQLIGYGLGNNMFGASGTGSYPIYGSGITAFKS